MSDFITRLAQRQLGQIASVMPRLPEMFAPSAPFAGLAPTPSVEETPAAAPAWRQTDAVSRPTLGAVASANSVASALVLTPKPNSPKAARGSAATQHAANQRTEAPRAASPLSPQSTDFAPVVAPRLTPTSKHLSELHLTRQMFSVQSSVVDVPDKMAPLRARSMSDQPAPLITIASSVPASITAPPRLEIKTNHGVAGVREAAAADAEAPIQVTIGRIEVTALTQSTPPKRAPAPRKPAMSLDDYLVRRQRRES